MTKRKMSVVRAPGTYNTPMIRIINNILGTEGFIIGTPIEVSYLPERITIKKVNKSNENII